MIDRPPRPATTHDARSLGSVLARGFADDPIWRWMAPSSHRWPERMAPVFRHLIGPSIRHRSTWTTDTHGGVAAWAPPGVRSFPAPAAIRSSAAMVRGLGAGGLVRTLRIVNRMEAVHPRERHWYLEFLATDSHLRGRGIGSSLIGPGLERADEEGVGAYLESSKPDNVPFYRRHGFEVIEELHAVDGAPPLWRMWRDPR